MTEDEKRIENGFETARSMYERIIRECGEFDSSEMARNYARCTTYTLLTMIIKDFFMSEERETEILQMSSSLIKMLKAFEEAKEAGCSHEEILDFLSKKDAKAKESYNRKDPNGSKD